MTAEVPPASSEVQYGTFTTLRDPAIVEMLGWAGYDFTIIDMEHSSLGLDEVATLIRVAEGVGLQPFVRVPRMDANMVLRVVECGARGVVAPHINSAAEVEAIVDMALYRPLGDRGMDPATRSARYGLRTLGDITQEVNDRTKVFIIIEDREALENLDEICSVPGVHGAFVGPSDLARSFGVPGEINHPDVLKAIATAADAFGRHGLRSCRAAFVSSEVRQAIDDGATYITTPIIDAYFISASLRDHLESVKA